MYLIVGIDTGKTSAIACLDLNGRIVHTESRRFADLGWFVESISKSGTPVVIATDKHNANEVTSKLATIFDAAIHSPEEDIFVREKRKLAKDVRLDVHQRDALSAAFSAYNHYANKIRQADRIAAGSGKDTDRIKALVIKKHSVHEAMSGSRSGRFVR